MKRTGTTLQKKAPTKKPALTRQVSRAAGYQAGRELSRQPKQELKAFDVALRANPLSTVATPPTFDVLNAVVNGAELYQRTGRKIYMKSLHIRGNIEPDAATSETTARILVIYDSQPNAAAPLITALLQDSNAAAATTWNSQINLINRSRFKIIKDYQVLLGFAGAATGQTEIVPDPILHTTNIDWFIPLHGLETCYNAVNGGTVADISSGAIFLVSVADTGSGYQMNYGSRLRYYD